MSSAEPYLGCRNNKYFFEDLFIRLKISIFLSLTLWF